MPDIITSYSTFKSFATSEEATFYIIEYNPNSYTLPEDKYSTMRREILQHPLDYAKRLDSGIYRIWTVTPYEKPW